MQIHELPSGTLTTSDVVAIDNGTSTRKYSIGSVIGTTSISDIGNGTVTGAISTLNGKVIQLAVPSGNSVNIGGGIRTVIWKIGSSGTSGIDVVYVSGGNVLAAPVYISGSGSDKPTYTLSAGSTFTLTNNGLSYLRGTAIGL